MEETILLEPSSKKKFQKTVSGIKKSLKKGKKSKVADSKGKGVVYLGHIPHGFYEEQMQSYFKQFGKVTNVRVARSKKNGRSKGYAFVEFEDKEVAEIVAETMNNYLMDKRLLKAECIPVARQHPSMFKGVNWVENKNCPGITNRKINKEAFNKEIEDNIYVKEGKQYLNRLYTTQKKLKEMGIEFNFTPSDVPELLKDYNPALNHETRKNSDDKLKNNLQLDSKSQASDKKTEKSGEKKAKKRKSKMPPKNVNVESPVQTKTNNKKRNKKVINKNKNVDNIENKLHKIKGSRGIEKKNLTPKKSPLSKKSISKDNSKAGNKGDLLKNPKKKKGFSKKL